MRITRVSVERTCSICERTLLMGERSVRFSPNGGEHYVDVCPLCQETAVENGWIKEGSPTTPTMPAERRRPRFSLAGAARPAQERGRRPGRERADPAAPLRARAGDRRGGGHLQRVAVPPHGRRDREEPRRAARLDRAALWRQSRRRRHRRLGDLLVPVPRHPRLRAAGAPRRARPRLRPSSRARSASGTRTSARTAASCRILRASDLDLP